MKQGQLIPKPPRKMLQPRKNEIRRRLEVAKAEAALASTPRWWRLFNRIRARVVETDPETAAKMPPMELK
jgi:hypothetical protein